MTEAELKELLDLFEKATDNFTYNHPVAAWLREVRRIAKKQKRDKANG